MKFPTVFCTSLVCLMYFLIEVDSCRCRVPHPQEAVCNYDYAILCFVFNIQYTGIAPNRRIKYTVFVLSNFKGPFNAYSITEIDAYESGATCGVRLDNFGLYLLTGRGTHVSSCNWQSKWSSLTNFQQSSLMNGVYSGTCTSGCSIVRSITISIDECIIDDNNPCHVTSDICTRNSMGICTWSNC